MSNNIPAVFRIGYGVFLIGLVPHVSWWILFIFIGVGACLFSFYLEAVVVALFYDALYATSVFALPIVPDTTYILTLCTILTVTVVSVIRFNMIDTHVS